jgi:hypothetical protein
MMPTRLLTSVPKELLRCNFPGLGILSMVDAVELPTLAALGPPDGYAWQPLSSRRPAVVNVEYDGDVPKGGYVRGSEFLFVLTVIGNVVPTLRRVK